MNHIIASFANSFLIVPANLVGSWPLVLAQTNMTSVSDFKSAAGTIVAILLIVAFISSLILWYVGTLQKESNPAASKWCFQAVWFTAIGLPFISLMFYIFVGADSVVSAKF